MMTLRLVACALAAALLGCRASTAPSLGVIVTASLRPLPAHSYEPLTLDLTVANGSSSTYFVSGSSGRCIGFVDLRDARGETIQYGDPRLCGLAATRHQLAPSDTLTDRLTIAGLPVGEYRVRAGVQVIDYGVQWSNFYPLSVVSRAP